MTHQPLTALLICTLSGLSAAQATETQPQIDAKAAVEAMNKGIGWLVRHQDENGGWSASQFQRHDPETDRCTGAGKTDQDLIVTALATFALLARGNTERVGVHREAVQKALRWLETQMQTDGFIGAPEAGNAVAAHALSCFALVEGKGISDQPPLQKSSDRLVALRLPSGTWPERLGEKKGDPMSTYWASMACMSSSTRGGRKVDLDPILAAMEKGELATPTPPSVEAMVRWFAHHQPGTDARLAELLDALGKQLPQWREGPDAARMNFLEWYLGTYATYNAGGVDWDRWYPALQQALVVHQRTDGAHEGSWDPVDANGKQGGRVYATAVNVLALSVGQRLGRVAQPAGAKKK